MDTLKPAPVEVAPQPFPPLDVSSISGIESWYRDLRPDRDITTIPTEVHVDALASSVLLFTDQKLPEAPRERLNAVLPLTTDIDRLGRTIALNGVDSLLVSDFIIELSERGENIPAPVERSLLVLSGRIAREVRDNPLTSPNDRVAANSRLANTEVAALQARLRRGALNEEDFSDAYIQSVRSEARWLADHSRDVLKGSLFETLVGGLAKYQAWTAGTESQLIVRHATMRGDLPSREPGYKTKPETAHDILVSNGSDRVLLQCKFGPAAPELEERYDRDKVTFIAETSDDGTLGTIDDFIDAFQALAGSAKFENVEKCDRWAQRYHLDQIIDSVGSRTSSLGQGAVALATKA